jgi:hypothetical protein
MHKRPRSEILPRVGPMDAPTQFQLRKVALIARDWRRQAARGPGRFLDGNMGFAPYFADIARVASDHGADTLLFCLSSHDAGRLGELPRKALFPSGTHHQVVVLGIERQSGEEVEVHFRPRRRPIRLQQHFGRTSDPEREKKECRDSLPDRRLGDAVLLLCGETNLINTERQSQDIIDPYGVLPYLRGAKVRIVLNPLHAYVRRHEMVLKLQAMARAAHRVVCVWNRGCVAGSEAAVPWAAYREGRTVTDQIQEVTAVPAQPGVRIGILTLT